MTPDQYGIHNHFGSPYVPSPMGQSRDVQLDSHNSVKNVQLRKPKYSSAKGIRKYTKLCPLVRHYLYYNYIEKCPKLETKKILLFYALKEDTLSSKAVHFTNTLKHKVWTNPFCQVAFSPGIQKCEKQCRIVSQYLWKSKKRYLFRKKEKLFKTTEFSIYSFPSFSEDYKALSL